MHIKKPAGRHKTFRILVPGTPITTLKHPELDAINSELLAGRVTLERASAQVKKLAQSLKPEKMTSWLPENEALAEAYWKAKIRPKRSNRVPAEAKRRIFWGVRQLGATAILSSTEDQLYEAFAHLNPRIKKRAAAVVNAILKWKGLNKYIHTEATPRHDFEYLTIEELELVVKELKHPEWKLCVQTAFATGCRYGELFDLTPLSSRDAGTHVYIAAQRKEKWERVDIKNKMTGTAWIISPLQEAVKQWLELPEEVKKKMRRQGAPRKQFKMAALKAVKKDVNFHNLRHSYARCMLTANEGKWTAKGVEYATLEDLSMFMRDLQSTVDRFYKSWVVSDAQMKANRRRFG